MPRLATLGVPLCDAQPPKNASARTVLQVRANIAGVDRGLTTASDISPSSYISLISPSGGDAIGEQSDGESEEVRLVPAQDGAEILRRAEGRPVVSRRPHDALARCRRGARGHLSSP